MQKFNPVAKTVRTGKFRKRIVRILKGKGSYTRKVKHV